MSYGERIAEIARENHLFCDVVEESGNVVVVEIEWGDWKHEHARLDWLVKSQMPELKEVTKEITDEDGSDCYSAIHRFVF